MNISYEAIVALLSSLLPMCFSWPQSLEHNFVCLLASMGTNWPLALHLCLSLIVLNPILSSSDLGRSPWRRRQHAPKAGVGLRTYDDSASVFGEMVRGGVGDEGV